MDDAPLDMATRDALIDAARAALREVAKAI